MALLQILEWPAPFLEARAKSVTEFDASLAKLAHDMVETMRKANGVGLAANQVGVLSRIIVTQIGPLALPDGSHKKTPAFRNAPYSWEGKLFVLVNPVIKAREGKITYGEGCLSFPELREDVERSRKITVEYQDLTGAKHSLIAEDLLAICLQHEIDHLEGIVFVNKLSEKMALKAKNRFLELKEKRKNRFRTLLGSFLKPELQK